MIIKLVISADWKSMDTLLIIFLFFNLFQNNRFEKKKNMYAGELSFHTAIIMPFWGGENFLYFKLEKFSCVEFLLLEKVSLIRQFSIRVIYLFHLASL